MVAAMEVDADPYDAAVQAVIARFEARLCGGEQKWACHALTELAFPPTHAVDPAKASSGPISTQPTRLGG